MISKDSQAKFIEMRESNKYCCLTIKSDYYFVWDVILIRAERKAGDKHVPCFRVCRESLDAAIDKAYKFYQEDKDADL